MQSPLGSYYTQAEAAPRRRHMRLPSRTPRRILIGLAVLAALPGLGTTFAPQISLGAQNPIEFGQGSAVLAACDSSIILTLSTAWNGTHFRLSGITVSDLNTTDAHCLDKTLTIKALDVSNGEIDLNGVASGNALSYTVPADVGASATVPLAPAAATDIDSTTVARVTVETS